MSVLVEAAVESFGRALAAQEGGCKRVELCGSLHNGGVTPSAVATTCPTNCSFGALRRTSW